MCVYIYIHICTSTVIRAIANTIFHIYNDESRMTNHEWSVKNTRVTHQQITNEWTTNHQHDSKEWATNHQQDSKEMSYEPRRNEPQIRIITLPESHVRATHHRRHEQISHEWMGQTPTSHEPAASLDSWSNTWKASHTNESRTSSIITGTELHSKGDTHDSVTNKWATRQRVTNQHGIIEPHIEDVTNRWVTNGKVTNQRVTHQQHYPTYRATEPYMKGITHKWVTNQQHHPTYRATEPYMKSITHKWVTNQQHYPTYRATEPYMKGITHKWVTNQQHYPTYRATHARHPTQSSHE